MMGLDNAGKSTILYRMQSGQYCETIPTIGFNCEKVKGKCGKSKNINFTIWDVGNVSLNLKNDFSNWNLIIFIKKRWTR